MVLLLFTSIFFHQYGVGLFPVIKVVFRFGNLIGLYRQSGYHHRGWSLENSGTNGSTFDRKSHYGSIGDFIPARISCKIHSGFSVRDYLVTMITSAGLSGNLTHLGRLLIAIAS